MEALKRAKICFTLPRGLPAAAGGPSPASAAIPTRVDLSAALAQNLTAKATRTPGRTWAGLSADLTRADAGGAGAVAPAGDRLPKDAYLVQVRGSLRPEWQAALARVAAVHPYAPPDTVRMVLGAAAVDAVRGLEFVTRVRRYGLPDTLTPSMVAFLGGVAEEAPDRPTAFDVTLHEAGSGDRVVALLAEFPAAKVLARGGRALRFEAPAGAAVLSAVAQLPEVQAIAPYTPPVLQLDEAVGLIGAGVVGPATPGGPVPAWTGAGEVVAIFDSGIDPTHPDLAPALAAPPAAYGAGSAIDAHGHGTHVAGIVAGRGVASGGTVRGVAPGAQVYSVGIRTASGVLDIPPDLGTLLALAVAAGAKVVNLSWRAKLDPDYDIYGESVDRFARANPDVLVVVAAGNEGRAGSPLAHPPDPPAHHGRHMPSTVGAPAVGKNVLTVGACRNVRPGYAATWGGAPGAEFLLPPASAEPVAGPPQFPAALSSRGPTRFSSVKPDLLAPGTMVLSAKASGAGAGAGAIYTAFGATPAAYGYLSGTSMATPMVAGAAAVVREYLRVARGTPAPSAALVKALLILAAVPLAAANSHSVLTGPAVGYPDFDQGFGVLDLRALLPHPAAPPGRRLAFADVRNDSPGALQARQPPGGPRRSVQSYAVTVPAGAAGPLRVALVWTDPPGRGVQNRMSLRLHSPGQAPVFGNETHPFYADPADIAAGAQVLDKNNNVLVAGLPAAAAGTYKLTVTAESTSVPYQGYALAVLGSVASDALPPDFP